MIWTLVVYFNRQTCSVVIIDQKTLQNAGIAVIENEISLKFVEKENKTVFSFFLIWTPVVGSLFFVHHLCYGKGSVTLLMRIVLH